ncbi:hypothetical protein K439DRAFT_1323416, partial [Ramaria rubella]
VAWQHRPYSIVEDPELLQILQMLYEPVEVPSTHMLSRDIQETFNVSRIKVTQILQEYPGKLRLGVDGWAAPNVFSYLGVTVTHCLAGDLVTMILNFIR